MTILESAYPVEPWCLSLDPWTSRLDDLGSRGLVIGGVGSCSTCWFTQLFHGLSPVGAACGWWSMVTR
jgi:hypothetical protein